jgi:hypothetical protein
MVLDLTVQPKFLLYGLRQQGFQCFLMFLRIVLVLARFEYFVRPSVRQKGKGVRRLIDSGAAGLPAELVAQRSSVSK